MDTPRVRPRRASVGRGLQRQGAGAEQAAQGDAPVIPEDEAAAAREEHPAESLGEVPPGGAVGPVDLGKPGSPDEAGS